MVYNCFIKCQVCGSITRVRLQVGWLEEHPIVIACGRCGISLTGKVYIDQCAIELKISFDNAEIINDNGETDYMVECSGEFPVKKLYADAHALDVTPFIRNQARMGGIDGYEKFRQSVFTLNKTVKKWTEYKRVFDLAKHGNKEYLIQEVKKLIPKQITPCRNELEVLKAVHMVEIIGFISPLRGDILSDITLSYSVLQLDLMQVKALIDYLDLHDGYRLNDLQSLIYKIMNEFVDVFQYIIPAFAVQFYKDDSFNYADEGSTTSCFDLVKQFYLDAYETLGNLLILPVALNNIKYRGSYENVNSALENGVVSLDDFIGLTKARRYHFCDKNELYTDYLQVLINSKLRNAISHNDVNYDTISQQITYIPNPKNRSEKLTTYLLEFENETVHLFQAILVIAEYLYRIKEIDLISKGQVPLKLDIPLNKRKKIGRNELCPCGSGKKFKKCCLGKGIYD